MSNKSVLFKITMISLLILGIVVVSSLTYAHLEDLTLLDSLYMTVITLTTTGYGDIIPQTSEGKIFTVFLLLSGVGVITYSISTILSYIASIDFSERRRIKMEKKVSFFEKHTIVCGFGRMGEIICKKLKDEDVNFVVIEKNEANAAILENLGYDYIVGDAAHDEVLEKAGVVSARVLVSVIDNDSDGLYIALAGRSFNRDIQIIIRANEPNAQRRMIRAGANKVVLPYVMSGLKVAESVINPAVEDFLSIKGIQGNDLEDELVQLADLYVDEDSELVNKALMDIGPEMKKMIIVGVRKLDRTFVFNPRGEYVFENGDCLIAMGDQESYCQTRDKYKLKSFLPHNNRK